MNTSNMKIIITGATGMVGEGVLYVCLEHPAIAQVLVVNRKPCGVKHDKLKEIIHPDFFDLSPIEDQLKGYHACFFCAGVSAVGMKEDAYFRITYTLTLGFAQTLSRLNPGLTFCYISGAGTDSSEKGKLMWARVKGKTENDLLKLPIRVYNVRPALMKPRKEARHAPRFYKYIRWVHKIGGTLFPNVFCTTDALGLAMIQTVFEGYSKKVIEVSDIKKLASS
ncbi:MAG: NAD-dependent epimerase/dehydratase family protein [Cyclobacteriaceae bacterium]